MRFEHFGHDMRRDVLVKVGGEVSDPDLAGVRAPLAPEGAA